MTKVLGVKIQRWVRPIIQKMVPDIQFDFHDGALDVDLILNEVNRKGYDAIAFWTMKEPDWNLEEIEFPVPLWWLDLGIFGQPTEFQPGIYVPSICLDRINPYAAGKHPSDLEHLLETFDFSGREDLIERAASLQSALVERNIARKTSPLTDVAAQIYGPKTRKRILVFGTSQSRRISSLFQDGWVSNLELVELAARENPGSQLIYQPPLDYLSTGHGRELKDIANIALVIDPRVHVTDAMHKVDHVYTVASDAGLDAVVRGVTVTTTALPFYAGWGLTDTRAPHPRRTRELTVSEFLGISTLVYPYYDPDAPEAAEGLIEGGSGEASQIDVALSASVANGEGGASFARAMQTSAASSPSSVRRPPRKSISARPGEKVSLPPTPLWYRPYNGYELSGALETGKPIFLYMPWIREHGDAVIAKIASSQEYTIAGLDVVADVDNGEARKEALRYARENPHSYRRLIARRLLPLRNKVHGFIFTVDWLPAMRIIADVCRDLSIPRILVPHESVFANREKYYFDNFSFASLPSADLTLGWGGLQREIFVERGYQADRFVEVGAPKFDPHFSYTPHITAAQFRQLYGLESHSEVILFASQPLDSQLDTRAARSAQRAAISDLLDYCEKTNCSLIVRLPPSKDNILGAALTERLMMSEVGVIDDANAYLTTPEESLYHSSIVCSVNSTMLFEAVLMHRTAISTKYIDFVQIWDNVGIPAARNRDQLFSFIDQARKGRLPRSSPSGMEWAASMFSAGAFDGQASRRISSILAEIARKERVIDIQPHAAERIFDWPEQIIDVAGFSSGEEIWEAQEKYYKEMLNIRTRVHAGTGITNGIPIASVDVFIQTSNGTEEAIIEQRTAQRLLGKPMVIATDGYIRSLNDSTSGEPALSITIDDATSYYDPSKPSRLIRLLNEGRDLSEEECERARAAIQKIVSASISRFNNAPISSPEIGSVGRRKVLVIDEVALTGSSPLEEHGAFDRMFVDVLRERASCDIVVFRSSAHPLPEGAAFRSEHRLAKTDLSAREVHVVDFAINPFSMLSAVDEVYTVDSFMGFEALMAEKPVVVYGAPFYAGWGLTEDRSFIPHRQRLRSLEEIFYYAYIVLSRYYSPSLGRRAEVEDVIDYIREKRRFLFSVRRA